MPAIPQQSLVLVTDACSILHVASPFHFDFQDPQSELVEPAKTGTLNALRAADSAPTIQRVVLTSSTAAVYVQGAAPERFIASRDWNTTSPQRYYEDPHSSKDKMDMYRASKSIAEMSAWDYVKDRTMRTWDMTSICPGYVFGPPVSHASKLSVSLSIFEPFLSGKKTDEDVTTRQVGNLVDVRDVALAHVRALEKEEAGFKRLGSSCGPFTWQHVVDAIHEAYPHLAKGLVPIGIPGSWKEIKDWTILDCQETEELLGFTHMSLQRTVQDTAQALWARQQTPQ
ncbi:unnamed protein product [Sympodiomycopsis kandeliae]